MAQGSNVIIIRQVLQENKQVLQENEVTSLSDLADKPKLFCKVFKEAFSLMRKALMSSSEDKIPTPTLEVIRDDLFILSDQLLQYPDIDDKQLQCPDYRIDNLYSLGDLNKIVDAARAEIIDAIGITKISSPVRSKRIQNCRDKIIQAIDMMKEFELRWP